MQYSYQLVGTVYDTANRSTTNTWCYMLAIAGSTASYFTGTETQLQILLESLS